MTRPDEAARVANLRRLFTAELAAKLPASAYVEELMDRPVVRVPARHPATGAITARVDADEIAVAIGNHFRCSFSRRPHEGGAPERADGRIAADAADYIARFMADAIVLRLTWVDGRVRSSETYAVGVRVSPPGPDDREFVWSGPR
jgi:hypothetical protein